MLINIGDRVLVKQTESNESGWGTVVDYTPQYKYPVQVCLDENVKLSDLCMEEDFISRTLLYEIHEILEVKKKANN